MTVVNYLFYFFLFRMSSAALSRTRWSIQSTANESLDKISGTFSWTMALSMRSGSKDKLCDHFPTKNMPENHKLEVKLA